jgi:hypothetical protein
VRLRALRPWLERSAKVLWLLEPFLGDAHSALGFIRHWVFPPRLPSFSREGGRVVGGLSPRRVPPLGQPSNDSGRANVLSPSLVRGRTTSVTRIGDVTSAGTRTSADVLPAQLNGRGLAPCSS